ncbi:glycosyltransferase family 1 protein [Okeania hirsuta]|uniref:Glycosyltransferase family 1 protein n=1 Tax=Okeania hirsuta TaxID=1458930 RepID=A0A3N6NWA3_9CYAN|nr:glycosyltransferase [Okeania hirsuta]RQH23981.1 glycosyltransferase family 1 protein [Okeania hirsuta]
MKILVSLPPKKAVFSTPEQSIDQFLEGNIAGSGMLGSTVRLANLLHDRGFEVCLSSTQEIMCSKFTCLKHENVEPKEFDWLIVHESHWDGISLTFGNQFLNKTFLWLSLYSCFSLVFTFIKAGGHRVICKSIDCANTFRSVPGWEKKVAVAYNSYNQIFTPDLENHESNRKALIFVGAIRPSKGFVEVMKIWSYLVQHKLDLKLKVAGSIQLHGSKTNTGSIGIADQTFESDYIEPWLESLPDQYQPHFLGSLTPKQLQVEINQSWGAIVNPSWYCTETFCVSAVEAQACNKTVFSVARGGLKETVYRGKFKSLATKPNPETIAKLIIQGLSNEKTIYENGLLAGDYVRSKFSNQAIGDAWINLLQDKPNEPYIPKNWQTPRDFLYDLLRYSKISKLYYFYRSPHDRKILSLTQKKDI